MSGAQRAAALVLDTNVVLDLLVFSDPATRELGAALACGSAVWVATQAMRDELERVLAYPALQTRLRLLGLGAAQVLAQFDRLSRARAEAARCSVLCSDADDQKFIDLAVHHGGLLLSKDKAVLRLRRRLAARGVGVRPAFRPAA